MDQYVSAAFRPPVSLVQFRSERGKVVHSGSGLTRLHTARARSRNDVVALKEELSQCGVEPESYAHRACGICIGGSVYLAP